ncbi:uncharacterized protein LOC128959445 [Oppia nitens]|uniref:uncharacterized protein LOC128959445 n=1 Tax=Oppia nitens TaxID=1686743 RepID=UPI0023D979C9|nr:uncharacterized protein LOC128959445 [Oppia nitens]
MKSSSTSCKCTKSSKIVCPDSGCGGRHRQQQQRRRDDHRSSKRVATHSRPTSRYGPKHWKKLLIDKYFGRQLALNSTTTFNDLSANRFNGNGNVCHDSLKVVIWLSQCSSHMQPMTAAETIVKHQVLDCEDVSDVDIEEYID